MRILPRLLGLFKVLALTVMWGSCIATAHTVGAFTNFESGHVRPLAISDDGTRLFAVNTPDARLEILRIGESGLTPEASVPVGLDPVSVAVRNDSEVWVVNHLSDSISIVDVASDPPRVVRTLFVGDEPRDVLFAGPNRHCAYITAARRGQNVPFDPQLSTPGVGRADVWVFDVGRLGDALGGTPLTILHLFGDTPRALAASPDGAIVYAAVFHSGNLTASVSEGAVCDGGTNAGPCSVGGSQMPGGLPGPNTNKQGIRGPETGLIVKFDKKSEQWRDTLGRDWSNAIRFNLPDRDVFEIDALAYPPVERRSFSGVGTLLFGMAVQPETGRVIVANTEASNEVRFEGPGTFSGSSVRGHLHEARLTLIDPESGDIEAEHLNPHINYDVVPSPLGTADRSLSTPVAVTFNADGDTAYVAALGSAKVAAFNVEALDAGNVAAARHLRLTGGGPSGLVFDVLRDRLYVTTRFDNGISIVDSNLESEIAHVRLPNPESPQIVEGRRFLYDADFTSSNGEASCASCHAFGDFDSLAWDLGDPDGEVIDNPNGIRVPGPGGESFHPMKGPMTTQTLRGMATHGPMHWRGDRTGGSIPGGNSFDESSGFQTFNAAFAGLLGRSGPLETADMKSFADFALTIELPPNPIRSLDNSLTTSQQVGLDFYMGPPSDVITNCNGCHKLDPSQGFFGTDGFMSFEAEPQLMKIPHLRNLYQKVGMFGMPAVPFFQPGNNQHMGDQVRGFGYLHDGSTDSVNRFLHASVFSFFGGEPQRRQLEDFLFAFDTDLAPIVGQQATLGFTGSAARVDLLVQRSTAGDCDLVAKGIVSGEERGWWLSSPAFFRSDRAAEAPIRDSDLRALAGSAQQPLTYTCTPPGSGVRMGIDRDLDGYWDRDERDAGSDPSDPNSVPVVRICTGDCNENGRIGVEELVRAVRIALGDDPLTACTRIDADEDGNVSIDELVLAVNAALIGCTLD